MSKSEGLIHIADRRRMLVTKRRLKRDDWLTTAMNVAYSEGEAELRIDKLCRRLGVTKGSFYAHFASRADFVKQLVTFWRDEYTGSVIVEMNKLLDQPAEARLLALMRILQHKGRASQDIVFRSWATHDPDIARGIEEVDRMRFEYVRSIFHDMGFRGIDLDLRTRLFVVYHSSFEAMQLPASELDADEEIKLRHAFFTRT